MSSPSPIGIWLASKKIMSQNIKKSAPDENFLDQTLRPNAWDEYIGQQNIKENLRILLTSRR
jgi:Holliday junction resolvasome RuvABC ATP-dependent DNA helicase subunit